MFLDIKVHFVDLRGLRSEYIRGFPGRESLANFPDLSCWGFDLVLESDSISCVWMPPPHCHAQLRVCCPACRTKHRGQKQPWKWGLTTQKDRANFSQKESVLETALCQHRAAGTPLERGIWAVGGAPTQSGPWDPGHLGLPCSHLLMWLSWHNFKFINPGWSEDEHVSEQAVLFQTAWKKNPLLWEFDGITLYYTSEIPFFS